ncbi:hypothetical protein BG003_002844 [Podila horticola]|nr:hypothetical protein BG003_002844 [Podila horticola]
MFFKTSTCTLLVVLAVALFTSTTPADAHSWAECIDWKFNNPGNEAWGDDDGKCIGYARRFPLGKEFGTLDDANPARHYQQGSDFTACSDRKHGKEKGSDETRANPPEKAYGDDYGAMTVTTVGDRLCVRWPAKTHAEKNESDKLMVLINLASKAGEDPSQDELTRSLVVGLPYKNCDESKDKDDKEGDRRPCGGCFTVPSRAPGIYTLQWRWMLNQGEWYTSCADINIKS